MTFETAVEHILAIEKGYVFDPEDPGGETNFGISKRSYPGYNIKDITRAEAISIYFTDFWTPIKAAELPDRIRLCMFDSAINQSSERAIKCLQGALILMGCVDVKRDGVLGPVTLKASKSVKEIDLLSQIIQLRLVAYGKLSTWPRFGEGWAKRLLIMTVESLR